MAEEEKTLDIDIPYDLWCDAAKNTKSRKLVAQIIVASVEEKIVSRSEWKKTHKHWLWNIVWWWDTTPLWERICTIVFAPILTPFALVYLAWFAITMIPLGCLLLWELVTGKNKKETDNANVHTQ